MTPSRSNKMAFITRSFVSIFPIIPPGGKSCQCGIVDLSNNNKPLKDRLYSFDSSLYHYDPDIFGGFLKDDHKLSVESLQMGDCCALWTYNCSEECLKCKNIDELLIKFKDCKIQAEVANKVSDIIDKTLCNNKCVKFKNGFNVDQMCGSYCVNLKSVSKIITDIFDKDQTPDTSVKKRALKFDLETNLSLLRPNKEQQFHNKFDIMLLDRAKRMYNKAENISKQITCIKVCNNSVGTISSKADINEPEAKKLVELFAQFNYYKDLTTGNTTVANECLSELHTNDYYKDCGEYSKFNNTEYNNLTAMYNNIDTGIYQQLTTYTCVNDNNQNITYEQYYNEKKKYYDSVNRDKVGFGCSSNLTKSISGLSRITAQNMDSSTTIAPSQQISGQQITIKGFNMGK